LPPASKHGRALRRERACAEPATTRRVGKSQRKVGLRRDGRGPLRPLGEHPVARPEQLTKPHALEIVGTGEAVPVEVMEPSAGGWIALNQRVGGAPDGAGDAERLEQAPHERRLAGTEFAGDGDEQRRRLDRDECGGERGILASDLIAQLPACVNPAG
jgi:hypothetical protein